MHCSDSNVRTFSLAFDWIIGQPLGTPCLLSVVWGKVGLGKIILGVATVPPKSAQGTVEHSFAVAHAAAGSRAKVNAVITRGGGAACSHRNVHCWVAGGSCDLHGQDSEGLAFPKNVQKGSC